MKNIESLSDQQMRDALRRAYLHNDKARSMGSCNAAYMGSMATHNLTVILGGKPMEEGLLKAIQKASRPDLIRGMQYCDDHRYLRPVDEPPPLVEKERNVQYVVRRAGSKLTYDYGDDWKDAQKRADKLNRQQYNGHQTYHVQKITFIIEVAHEGE